MADESMTSYTRMIEEWVFWLIWMHDKRLKVTVGNEVVNLEGENHQGWNQRRKWMANKNVIEM